MKHLKHIFESTHKEIKQDLEDICLELSDQGYSVNINTEIEQQFAGRSRNFIVIIEKHPFIINYKDIKDCVKRMEYYMKLNGYYKRHYYVTNIESNREMGPHTPDPPDRLKYVLRQIKSSRIKIIFYI